MHYLIEVLTVPQSSCSVIKHAHSVLLVHVFVMITFAIAAYIAFSSMASADGEGDCDEPIFGMGLPAKVGLAFLWGVMMNVVTPVA
jgi:hypothetical protein